MATRPQALLPDAALPRLRLRRRRRVSASLIAGALLLAVALFAALLPQALASGGPYAFHYGAVLKPPSPAHIFGTDEFGRSVYTRVVYGTRIDLQIGFFCVLFPFVFGSLMGLLSAYYGGLIDTLTMRAVDILIAFPFLVLVIAIVAMLGPSVSNLYIAVSVVDWITYARIVRAETLSAKSLEYVQAARVLGYSNGRILFRHILPNVITQAIVYAMSDVILEILLGAALGFLGLGAQPPLPEWGAMVSQAQGYLTQAWWMSFFPGVAILFVGIAFSLLGDGLADFFRLGES